MFSGWANAFASHYSASKFSHDYNQKIKHVNSSVKHWYIKLISRINNAIEHRCGIKILNISRPVAMEMAKFQNDFVVMTTTLEPKCFQIVYKAAKGGAKWQLLFLKQVTRYKFRIPDILSRCFKKKTSVNSFFTNTDGTSFYKAPAFVVSSIVHIALNLGSQHL